MLFAVARLFNCRGDVYLRFTCVEEIKLEMWVAELLDVY